MHFLQKPDLSLFLSWYNSYLNGGVPPEEPICFPVFSVLAYQENKGRSKTSHIKIFPVLSHFVPLQGKTSIQNKHWNQEKGKLGILCIKDDQTWKDGYNEKKHISLSVHSEKH